MEIILEKRRIKVGKKNEDKNFQLSRLQILNSKTSILSNLENVVFILI